MNWGLDDISYKRNKMLYDCKRSIKSIKKSCLTLFLFFHGFR